MDNTSLRPNPTHPGDLPGLPQRLAVLEEHARHVPGILYQTRSQPDGAGFCIPVIRGRTLEYLGYTPEEIEARPTLWLEAIHPDDWGSFLSARREAAQKAQPFELEFRIVSRTGRVRWLSAHSQPQPLPGGEVAFNGVAIDITRQKQVEEELRQATSLLDQRVRHRTAELSASEERFRQLAENIEEVFWISTPDKSQMLYISPTYEKVFCRSCQSLYDNPKSFADPVHAEDRERLQNWLPQQAQGPCEIEYRIVRPTGHVRWIWTRTFPVHNELGELYRVVGITRDITSQRRYEEKLRNEQQLMKKLLALQDRERKLIAHEIHDGLVQYITGSKMMIEGLRHQMQTGGKVRPDELGTVTDALGQAINEGRRLIGNLRPLIIDEEGLIEAINHLVAEETGRGALAISFTHATTFEHLPPLLETTLFRIVQESMTNIRRHARASRAEIRLVQDEGQIKLEIRDDGTGFDPEHIPEGRYGVRGIVERARLFGGSAQIKSELGRGTLVAVRMPLDLEEPL